MNPDLDEVDDHDFWTIESFVQEHFGELPRPEFEQPQFNPEEFDRVEIDSDRLFDDQVIWDFQPTEEELSDFENAMHQGPPTEAEGKGGLKIVGWDTCAWYRPIHFHGPSWGIYIKEGCVFSTAKQFARFIRPTMRGTKTAREWFNIFSKAAIWVLYLHEHYHHRVESFGIRLHVVTGHSKYVPYENQVYGVLKSNLGKFPNGPYINSWDPDEQIEEALANANSFIQIGSRTYSKKLGKEVVMTVRNALRWSFRFDPPGYRKALHYLNRASFKVGESILQTRVLLANLSPTAARPWHFAPGMTKSFFGHRSKFWAVVDKNGRCRFPII